MTSILPFQGKITYVLRLTWIDRRKHVPCWATSFWQSIRVIQVLALWRSSFIAEFHEQQTLWSRVFLHPVQHHIGDIPPLAPHQTHRKRIESTPTAKAVTDLKIFDDFLHNRSPDSQWMTSTAEMGNGWSSSVQTWGYYVCRSEWNCQELWKVSIWEIPPSSSLCFRHTTFESGSTFHLHGMDGSICRQTKGSNMPLQTRRDMRLVVFLRGIMSQGPCAAVSMGS